MASWVYLTLSVIVALIALGVVAINTALEQASTQVNYGIAIDTKTRYVGESNNTILNSTQQFIDGEDVMIKVIIEPQGRLGGNWGGLEPQDKITLAVSAEEPIYGDISYFDVKKQEWIIVEQALSKEFTMMVQIPEEQSIFNFKWGIYVLNPNADPVMANIQTIITKS